MAININAANQFSKPGAINGGEAVEQKKNFKSEKAVTEQVLSTKELLAATGANEVKGATTNEILGKNTSALDVKLTKNAAVDKED